eukprot:13059111-Alexandrium_andersonii.AAC.1
MGHWSLRGQLTLEARRGRSGWGLTERAQPVDGDGFQEVPSERAEFVPERGHAEAVPDSWEERSEAAAPEQSSAHGT